jgi:hypothetical protein
MKTKLFALTILAMATLLCYCTKDFIEPNISSKWVYIISPQNGVVSPTATPTFMWNLVDGARTYNLQIAYPSFANSSQFILDTTVSSLKFVWTLQPGKSYEWRICAKNTVSSTPYTTYALKIDSTSNLSAQSVVFTQPLTNPYNTNAAIESFAWSAVPAATEYRLQLINQSNSSILKDTTITSLTYSIALPAGAYTCQVRAQNTSTNTPYTAITVNVNRTAPGASSQVSPLNGANVTGADTLVWTRSAGAVSDSLFIAIDSTFASAPPFAPVFTSNIRYVLTGGQIGTTYFWRLKSRDIEGNWSGYSVKWKFIQH